MKITFKAEDYGDNAIHTVSINGEEYLYQSEDMEPEDVRFHRSLRSPHDCEDIIIEAIEATKRGEEVTFEHVYKDLSNDE